MGKPDFMICMDSGCIDYNTLWITTSLRGIAKVDLTVEVLQESVHSGTGSGIAPDSFSIMRQLLDRLEDSKTSKVTDALQVEIPDYRIADAKKLADYQKEKIVEDAVKLSEYAAKSAEILKTVPAFYGKGDCAEIISRELLNPMIKKLN